MGQIKIWEDFIRMYELTDRNSNGILQYGIKCKEGGEVVHDISPNHSFVQGLVNKFNDGGLDPLHFMDAVEDALS